eukprot:TRINITY_DN12857_c0_g1_i1.p2 TRINITY_DN12857_c0_g1~~TRINITY_DN12857_c0_g1_i1.p2  ORF type:complete len:590 (+),score=154.13 TRINITY_DN12857_c0_g1_i1:44-1771(+)
MNLLSNFSTNYLSGHKLNSFSRKRFQLNKTKCNKRFYADSFNVLGQGDVFSDKFKANKDYMQVLIDDLDKKMSEIKLGGSQRAVQKHLEKGKMLVRDRINGLIDPGSPFLEFSAMAGYETYPDPKDPTKFENVPAGGIITGIGTIQGRECVIIANDATVKGGTFYPITIKKKLRAQEIALENQLPVVYLVDSGGANLQYQEQIFPDKENFGRIFYNQARMSEQGIPQIATVMGSCTAGGAYVPSMADESVIVKNTGTIFLGGPPLVKAAIGEDISANDLGGADVHCKISGVTDHYAINDQHALDITRRIAANFTSVRKPSVHIEEPVEPLYPIEDIYGFIPEDTSETFDMRNIISRIVDGSVFDEFKKHYGSELITGFARIQGYPVGILANNGVLHSASSQKAAHFIQICNQRNTPILFLQNITGYMVGSKAEYGGIAKDGAKMVRAVSCAKVPKFTIIVKSSFGAGNYGMCGRAFSPNFLWMYPTGRISVMGGKQAAFVLSTVASNMSEEESEAFKKEIEDRYDHHGSPYYSSARLWDDGILDPKDTRKVLGMALSVTVNTPEKRQSDFGVFRM